MAKIYAVVQCQFMIQVESVVIDGNPFEFMKMDMGNAPLVVLKGRKGFVMCGYLNLEASQKIGDLSVRVTGVKDLETVLASTVAGMSEKAAVAGIKEGQKVSEILHLLA